MEYNGKQLGGFQQQTSLRTEAARRRLEEAKEQGASMDQVNDLEIDLMREVAMANEVVRMRKAMLDGEEPPMLLEDGEEPF